MRRALLAATMIARASALLPVERFAVAPMMDYTDRHFRALFRLLSNDAVLYTEMVTANTLVDATGAPRHGDGARWLRDGDAAGKTILQLGGADPARRRAALDGFPRRRGDGSRRRRGFRTDVQRTRRRRRRDAATMIDASTPRQATLAAAARLAKDHHAYAGYNLNCGCPSDRVAGSGCFGAALMRDAGRVAECAAAMSAVGPTSIKCRVGVCETVRDLVDRPRGRCHRLRDDDAGTKRSTWHPRRRRDPRTVHAVATAPPRLCG